ncbi:dienelactone hydrolase family protein [Paracoccus aerodenitrificans]|uniref:dienelactone hydrolase family protein n=1 Tax=Paracoccus aerodenitrificans TaxID=3017781 RepID=UPI0022F08ADE|nr:dienelactone hydrolase family protein [Paracoccus aerodenitrificans]WBU63027.1 dienelactone hydrolase family protein [Paracoccus aerodenitrificans]
MKRRRVWLIVAFLLLIPVVIGVNTLRNWAGIAAVTDTPQDRLTMLSPGWRMVPEGPVSDAGAVLLSGCDGVHDNMEYWAGTFAERGHPGLILDSHTPRDLDQMESWRLLCMGQVLTGAERAGDLAVAMAASKRDDVILLGASHGGWSVLEFIAQTLTGEVAPGLSEWPAPPKRLLDRVGAAIVLYPYCGALNGAVSGDWSDAPPMLMIIAGQDELRLAPDCEEMAAELRKLGASIDLIYYEEAGHGFEQQERAAFSVLEFNAELRDRATSAVNAFLDRNGL